MKHDPKLVEAISAATCDAFHNGECVTTAALGALCAHLKIAPEALRALADGEAVVVPREASVEMLRSAHKASRKFCSDEARNAARYRAMLAASPYAREAGDA